MNGLAKLWTRGRIAAAIAFLSASATGRSIDPTVAQSLVPGSPRAAVRYALPSEPQLLWQARLQGTISQPPAVSRQGDLIVATAGRLSQLGANGKLSWTLRIRGAAAAAPPLLAPNASRLLITTRGELLVAGPDGRLLRQVQLPLPSAKQLVFSQLAADGTFVLAVDKSVYQFDVDGQLLAQTDSTNPVSAVALHETQVFFATRTGELLRWIPGVDTRSVGSFAGVTKELHVLRTGRIIAVVDRTRLVELDLAHGQQRIRHGADGLALDSAPAVDPTGTIHVATSDGLLVSFDSRGNESRRVLLSASLSSRPIGGTARLQAGRRGKVAFVLPTGEFGVVHRGGEVRRAAVPSCRSPTAVVSTGDDHVAVLCSSGLVMGFGPAPESVGRPTGDAKRVRL